MIVDIYPSEYVLSRDGDICCRWMVHDFIERPASAKRTEAGFLIENIPRSKIVIGTMHGKLSDDKKWLKLMNGRSYDATTILFMARNNRSGLKIVEAREDK